MPAFYTTHERREGADRNDLALAALQLCRRWRAHPGISSAKYYWINPSNILMFAEGAEGAFNIREFNRDHDNAAAVFALDDLARMTSNQMLGDAASGQATYQTAGSPTGAS